jgi:ribosomal protein S18 acetylase RimI-like enzyme
MSGSDEIRVGLAETHRFVAECRALWLAVRNEHAGADAQMGVPRGDDDSWARAADVFGALLAAPGAFLVLAEQDGADAPVGCALVTLEPGSMTWEGPDPTGDLQLISVLPAARGLGLGTRLIDAVQAELDRLGTGELRLSVMAGNLGAQAFYRELGFTTYSLNLRRSAP